MDDYTAANQQSHVGQCSNPETRYASDRRDTCGRTKQSLEKSKETPDIFQLSTCWADEYQTRLAEFSLSALICRNSTTNVWSQEKSSAVQWKQPTLKSDCAVQGLTATESQAVPRFDRYRPGIGFKVGSFCAKTGYVWLHLKCLGFERGPEITQPLTMIYLTIFKVFNGTAMPFRSPRHPQRQCHSSYVSSRQHVPPTAKAEEKKRWVVHGSDLFGQRKSITRKWLYSIIRCIHTELRHVATIQMWQLPKILRKKHGPLW